MKRFLGVVLFLTFVIGGSGTVWGAPPDRNEDHVKLRALKTQVVDAFNKQDAQAIAACCTKDFALTTIDQTTLTSADQIKSYFQQVFKSPDALLTDLKIAPEADILTQFIDDNNGYCYGKNHEIYTLKGGTKTPVDSRWTALVHKENGQWKIAALHAGVNFVDNPVLARSENRMKIMTVVGFGAGVILALLFGALLRRRPAQS